MSNLPKLLKDYAGDLRVVHDEVMIDFHRILSTDVKALADMAEAPLSLPNKRGEFLKLKYPTLDAYVLVGYRPEMLPNGQRLYNCWFSKCPSIFMNEAELERACL